MVTFQAKKGAVNERWSERSSVRFWAVCRVQMIGRVLLPHGVSSARGHLRIVRFKIIGEVVVDPHDVFRRYYRQGSCSARSFGWSRRAGIGPCSTPPAIDLWTKILLPKPIKLIRKQFILHPMQFIMHWKQIILYPRQTILHSMQIILHPMQKDRRQETPSMRILVTENGKFSIFNLIIYMIIWLYDYMIIWFIKYYTKMNLIHKYI